MSTFDDFMIAEAVRKDQQEAGLRGALTAVQAERNELLWALERIVAQADSDATGMMPLHTVASVIDARHLLAKVKP